MSVPSPKRSVSALGFVLLAASLTGCVATTAELSGPSGESGLAGARPPVNPQAVALTQDLPIHRQYVSLGAIRATAFSLNLLSSAPTRANVDEALRAQAADLGADAVIGVRYRTESQGLASRGRIVGEGEAVAWR